MVLWRSPSLLAHPPNHFHPRARQPQGPAPAREGARALPCRGSRRLDATMAAQGFNMDAHFFSSGSGPLLSHTDQGGVQLKISSPQNLQTMQSAYRHSLPAHPVLPKSVRICGDVHPPPNEPTGFWTNSKHADQGAASRTTALQNTNVFSSESPGWFSSVGNTGWWSKWHCSLLT